MASEIRVNKINSQTGVGTITLSPTGVDISGITTAATLKVGTGVTLSSDGDSFFTGVCTATTFSGSGASLTNLPAANLTGTLPAISGANLTGITQTTINGNAANRLIAGSDTANTLSGQANLTFGSDLLNISSTTQGLGLRLRNTGNEYTQINFDAARTAANNALGIIDAKWNNNHTVASIYLQTGSDTTNKDDGQITFFTASASGSQQARMIIKNGGDVSIEDGNLTFASGHGIDFSATGDGSGTATSELLDDYEEGTWSPTVNNGFSGISYSIQRGWYVRIGNLLHASFFLRFSAAGASTHMRFSGLPYTSADLSPAYSSGGNVNYTNIPGIDSSSNVGNQSIWIGTNSSIFELYSNGNSSSATGSGGFSDKDIYGKLEYRVG